MAAGEMSPFTDAQTDPNAALPGRFLAPQALLAFAACLLIGLGAVAWRASRPGSTALAGAQGAAISTQLERQFAQAAAAAETLTAVAQQYGGAFPNFQKVAADLLAAHPGITTIEWQPGGLVADIAPRAGYETLIGRFNVLSNPEHKPGAIQSYQRRRITVTGPLSLYRGGKGIVVRAPVFQRGRDGKEVFNLISVSMSIDRAVEAARSSGTFPAEAGYALCSQDAPGRRSEILASRGSVSANAVRLPVKLQDVELLLAVQPKLAHFSWGKIGFECFAVLIFATLAALSLNLLEHRNVVEENLADTNRRLNRAISDRKQAEEGCRTAQDNALNYQAQLKLAQAAVEKAQAAFASNQSHLGESVKKLEQQEQASRARLLQAESVIEELRARLKTATESSSQAAQTSQTELEQAQNELAAAQQTINEQQNQLAQARRAQEESAAKSLARHEQDAAALAELQARFDAAIRAAEKGAEKAASQQARLEQANKDLKKLLQQAEESTTARIEELTQLLQQAESNPRAQAAETPLALEPQPAQESAPAEASPAPETAQESFLSLESEEPAAEPPTPRPAAAPAETDELALLETSLPELPEEPARAEETPAPAAEPEIEASPATEETELNLLDLDEPLPAAPSVEAELIPTAGDQEKSAAPQPAPPEEENDANSLPSPEVGEGEAHATAEPSQPASSVEAKTEAPATEPAATEKQAAPPKRRKSRRDDQMDLFGGAPAPAETSEKPAEAPAPRRKASEPEDSKFDPAEFRKASNVMLVLLTDQDPGARDCLKDNRALFRSAFGRDEFESFEQAVKSGGFGDALEHLKKATRKHG
jgi:sensor domain CHASE-containing protein